jgi:hypothetical protein
MPFAGGGTCKAVRGTDESGCALGDHVGGERQLRAWDPWHDACVDHTQPADASHAQLLVHNVPKATAP